MFQIINLNVLNARCCPPVKREKSIPTQPRPEVETSSASPTWRQRSGGPAHQRAGARLNTATDGACSSERVVSTAYARQNPTERIVETPARNMLSRLLVLEVIVRAAAAASPRRLHSRMNWWNSPRCEFYRSVRNAVKLTKCWEILWSEPFRGLLWPNLWSEAGHIWARTTFPFICCAAGIGLHNCRHYNWLACVQPGLSAQKVNTTVKNNQSVIDASLHIIRNLSS